MPALRKNYKMMAISERGADIRVDERKEEKLTNNRKLERTESPYRLPSKTYRLLDAARAITLFVGCQS
jgi:hypothetical protein